MKKRRRREKNVAAKTRYRIFGLAADATCLCCLIDLLVAIGYSREIKLRFFFSTKVCVFRSSYLSLYKKFEIFVHFK